MARMMTLLFAVLMLCVLSPRATAQSVLPAEIEAYVTEFGEAADRGDMAAAREAAKTAWRMAEKDLGDNVLTGDVAFLLAESYPRNSPFFESGEYHRAFKRAIELARLTDEADRLATIFYRHGSYINFDLFVMDKNNPPQKQGGNGKSLDAMKADLATFNQMDSAFAADYHALRAWQHHLKDRPKPLIPEGERALELYAALGLMNRRRNISQTRRILGEAYEATKQPLRAARHYQALFETLGPSERWSAWQKQMARAFFNIYDRVKSGDIASDGGEALCETCPPFFESETTKPILEFTADLSAKDMFRMKRAADVFVLFDINDDGAPENVRVAASTSKSYHKMMTETVAAWRYTRLAPGGDRSKRKDILAHLDIKVVNEQGREPEARPLKIHIQSVTEDEIEAVRGTGQTLLVNLQRVRY